MMRARKIRELILSHAPHETACPQQLAQALSSNSLRGVWGETQLRKLIELAGLIKHADFSEQVTISTDAGAERSGRWKAMAKVTASAAAAARGSR